MSAKEKEYRKAIAQRRAKERRDNIEKLNRIKHSIHCGTKVKHLVSFS